MASPGVIFGAPDTDPGSTTAATTPGAIYGVGSTTTTAAPASTSHHRGLFGEVAHIGHQFVHGGAKYITQAGPGLFHAGEALGSDVISTFTNPLNPSSHFEHDVIGPTASAYRAKYISPRVLHNIAEDPFGTFVDLATIGSMGAGRAFAVGTLPEEGASVTKALITGKYQGPLRTIDVQGSLGAAKTVRTLPRQGARAARMIATDKLLKKLPATTPGIGEDARYARAINADTKTIHLKHLASDAYVTQQRTWAKLSPKERIAANIINKVPLPHDLAAWRDKIPAEDKASIRLARQLDDPKVLDLYHNPTAKMEAAHDAASAAAEYKTRLQIANGGLTQETADLSPLRHIRLARGATFVKGEGIVGGYPEPPKPLVLPVKHDAFSNYSSLDVPLDDLTKLMPKDPQFLYHATSEDSLPAITQEGLKPGKVRKGEVHGNYFAEDGLNLYSLLPGVKRGGVVVLRVRKDAVNPEATDIFEPGSGFTEWVSRDPVPAASIEYLGPDQTWHPLGGGGISGPEQLRAEIRAAGRPMPYHAPDKMADPRSKYVGGKSGGRTPPPTDIHQSEGTLFNQGKVALHIDTLGPSFLRASMRDAAVAKHAEVVRAAVASESGNLAHGYRWVRLKRGQAIAHTKTAYGAHVHDIDESLPEFGDEGLTDARPDADPATIQKNAAGKPLMVPERFAATLENDLTVQRSLLARLDHQILQVWRALILNLRIPWLENNVFGNTVLAGIRFAGPRGLVAVLGMIQETKGMVAARKALGFAESNGVHLSDALLREKLPELSRGGTFIGSQLPTGMLARRSAGVQRAVRAAGTPFRVLPAIDRASEGALRRASAETVLRGSDEVKAIYKAMLPPVPNGHIRLFRGEREDSDSIKQYEEYGLIPDDSTGHWFTNDAREGMDFADGGDLYYLDIPRAVAMEFKNPTGFLVPGNLAEHATAITGRSVDLVRAMPQQTRSWQAAMSQGLDNPDLRRLVVREVNDALGNFLSLTPAEAGAIRSLIPFYAWFREISRIAAKLPIDAPGRTELITNLGAIGAQQQDSTLGPLPSYLQGSVPLGKPRGDLQSILNLRSANPLTSAVDVGSSLGALLPGGTPANVNKLLGELNPLIQAGIAGANDVTDTSRGVHPSRFGLLADALAKVATDLPETRIGTNPPSRLYPDRTREDLLWQFLGDLRRTISLQQAHYKASQGG